MSVDSISTLKESVQLLDKQMHNFNHSIDDPDYSNEEIIELIPLRINSIPFLEKKHAELLLQKNILTKTSEICVLNKEEKKLKELSSLQEQLDKSIEIWERCYNKCQKAKLESIQNSLVQPFNEDSDHMLSKLLRQLEQLSMNPLIKDDEQKKLINEIKERVRNALSQAKEFKIDALETEDRPLINLEETHDNWGTFDGLNVDAILNILSRLSIEDFLLLSQTSKAFKNMCDNSQAWKAAFGEEKEAFKEEIWIEKIKNQLFTTGIISRETLSLLNEEGIVVHSSSTFKEDNVIYSGCSDGTIRILNSETNECIATLEKHQGNVNCLFKEGNILYSGSSDGTIKIWNLKKGQCIATIQGYQGSIDFLLKKGNILYSGNDHCPIKMWNFNVSYSDLLEAAHQIVRMNVSRFSIFSEECKKAIHKELRSIYQGNFVVTEDAFLERNGISMNEKRAEAIYRFVARHIAFLFGKGLKKAGIDLFKKLPDAIKKDVFHNLYEIEECKTTKYYFHDADKAFLNLDGLDTTNEKRKKAILNYLQLELPRYLLSE